MTRTVMLALFSVLAIGLLVPVYAATSDTLSPLKQMKMGIPIDEIQCSDDKILMQSSSGKPACLRESTATKLADRGFTIVVLKEKTEINYNDNDPKDSISLSDSVKTQLKMTTPEFLSTNIITQTNYDEEFNELYSLGHAAYFWPKLNMTFPEQVRIGEPFDVVMDYTYILPDEDTRNYDDPEEQCMAESCERKIIWIVIPTYIEYLGADDAVVEGTFEDFLHLPVRTEITYSIDPPFDNTKPLQEIFTFVINEPDIDYRYGTIDISFNGDRPAVFYFHAAPNGVVYFDDELMQNLGEGPGQLRDTPRESNAITREMRIAAGPVDGPPEALWERFKDHMLNKKANDWLDGKSIREALESNPELKRSWIDKFLKFYPELDTQSFNPVLNWILPQAYGQESPTSLIFDRISNTDLNGTSSSVHVSTHVNLPRPLITFEFPREFIVGEPQTITYTYQWNDDAIGWYDEGDIVSDVLAIFPDEFSTSANYTQNLFAEQYTPHIYTAYMNKHHYSDLKSESRELILTLDKPMQNKYDFAKIMDSSYQLIKIDNGVTFNTAKELNNTHVYFDSFSADNTEIGSHFWDRYIIGIGDDGTHTPLERPEPQVSGESESDVDYVPIEAWDGWADLLRMVNQEYGVTDYEDYMINVSNLSQKFVDDFLEGYPEFRTQNLNGGVTGNVTLPSYADNMSPLKQYNMGIPIDEIQCSDDKILMQSTSGKPACLRESTAAKLSDRGFTIVVLKENISIEENVELSTSDNLIEKQYDEFELLFINHYLFKDKEGIPETISYKIRNYEETIPAVYYGSGSFKSNYDSYTFSYRIWGDHLGYFGVDGYDDNCLPKQTIQHYDCSNNTPLEFVRVVPNSFDYNE